MIFLSQVRGLLCTTFPPTVIQGIKKILPQELLLAKPTFWGLLLSLSESFPTFLELVSQSPYSTETLPTSADSTTSFKVANVFKKRGPAHSDKLVVDFKLRTKVR